MAAAAAADGAAAAADGAAAAAGPAALAAGGSSGGGIAGVVAAKDAASEMRAQIEAQRLKREARAAAIERGEIQVVDPRLEREKALKAAKAKGPMRGTSNRSMARD